MFSSFDSNNVLSFFNFFDCSLNSFIRSLSSFGQVIGIYSPPSDARPSNITLKIKAQGNANLSSAVTNAFFVLKFDYANPYDTGEELLNQYTPTL